MGRCLGAVEEKPYSPVLPWTRTVFFGFGDLRRSGLSLPQHHGYDARTAHGEATQNAAFECGRPFWDRRKVSAYYSGRSNETSFDAAHKEKEILVSVFNRFLAEKEEAPIIDRCRICYFSVDKQPPPFNNLNSML